MKQILRKKKIKSNCNNNITKNLMLIAWGFLLLVYEKITNITCYNAIYFRV